MTQKDFNSSDTVSVIIPTYNRAHVLPRAIDSVLEQTYENYEILLIDDASTDNTEEVIEKYSSKDIHYHRFKENRGANAARNKGIDLAQGKYVMLLDSDDKLKPSAIETSVETITNQPTDCAGVVSSFQIIENGEVSRVRNVPAKKITLDDLAENNIIGGFSATMFRTEVFNSLGGLDENLKKAQDVDFYIRVLKKYSIQGLDDVLYQKYQEPDRITANPDRRIQGETRILEKHADVLTQRHKATRFDSRGVAYGTKGDMRNATRDFIRAIRCYPFLWYTYYHLVLSFLGKYMFKKGIRRSLP